MSKTLTMQMDFKTPNDEPIPVLKQKSKRITHVCLFLFVFYQQREEHEGQIMEYHKQHK